MRKTRWAAGIALDAVGGFFGGLLSAHGHILAGIALAFIAITAGLLLFPPRRRA